MEPTNLVTVVILNDGKTFTDISCCSICIVRKEEVEEILRGGGDAKDLNPLVEIALDSVRIG